MNFLSAHREITAATVTGIFALITGTAGMLIVNRHLEKRRELISTKREQLSKFYSPLEILLKINKLEFDRYFEEKTTKEEKEFIEKEIWYHNNREIKKIIMENGHQLPDVPQAIMELLRHINVWMSVYDVVHVKKEKEMPVFGGTRGYPYPKDADTYIYNKAAELRSSINKKITNKSVESQKHRCF